MIARAALLPAGMFAASGSAAAAELLGDAAETFELDTVATGLEQPTDVAALPDGTLLISERHGRLAVVLPDGAVSAASNQITVNAAEDEQGLLGVAVDQDFDRNRWVFLYASLGESIPDRHKVLRARLDEDNELIELSPIIEKGLLGFANHAGGGLVVHEHQLYVSVGDAGGNNTVPPSNQLGTCLNSANGKILRVNLDGSVPSDNPLVGRAAVTGCEGISKPIGNFPPDERIYAWGLRNPFRFAVDSVTGLLWVADVGDRAREEVSVGGKGSHFGWPFYEGTVYYERADQPFQPDGACEGVEPAGPCVAPVYEYPHESKRNAVIGGPLLNACDWPPLWKSRYLFGDNGSGEVWTLDTAPDRKSVVANSLRSFAKLLGPSSLRLGLDRSLYLVDVAAGEVYRVRPRAPLSEACQPDGPAGAAGAASGSEGGGDAGAGQPGLTAAGETSVGGVPGKPVDEGMGGAFGGTPDDAPSEAEASGCGCRMGRGTTAWAWLAVSVLGIALPWWRRRRGRSTRSTR